MTVHAGIQKQVPNTDCGSCRFELVQPSYLSNRIADGLEQDAQLKSTSQVQVVPFPSTLKLSFQMTRIPVEAYLLVMVNVRQASAPLFVSSPLTPCHLGMVRMKSPFTSRVARGEALPMPTEFPFAEIGANFAQKSAKFATIVFQSAFFNWSPEFTGRSAVYAAYPTVRAQIVEKNATHESTGFLKSEIFISFA
ncbi:MAG: hypothetical protein QMC36_06425 [Patescibacteria group bacterium]